MSRFLTDENVIPIYKDVIVTSDYVVPTYEDVILTYEIRVLTYRHREVIKSESVTPNRCRIEVTTQLHHWINWGLTDCLGEISDNAIAVNCCWMNRREGAIRTGTRTLAFDLAETVDVGFVGLMMLRKQ